MMAIASALLVVVVATVIRKDDMVIVTVFDLDADVNLELLALQLRMGVCDRAVAVVVVVVKGWKHAHWRWCFDSGVKVAHAESCRGFIFSLGLSRALSRCCVEPDTEDNEVFQSCKPGSIFKLDSTLLS